MDQKKEWVGLGEAAKILGVHPTTVRHWADQGDIPVKRTPGGHRRFKVTDLEGWVAIRHNSREIDPKEAQLLIQNALGRSRMIVSAGHLESMDWYNILDEETRKSHRTMGRELLELLMGYIGDPEDRDNLLQQVRDMGIAYANVALQNQITLIDSIQAFLFFRDLLSESVIQLAEVLTLRTPSDWSSRLRQVNHITDEILLALVEEYQRGQ